MEAYQTWDARSCNADHEPLSWKERYIIFLWLSHLLLAPFDIASISSVGSGGLDELPADLHLPQHVPSTARSVLLLGLQYIGAAGKERDSALAMLVRLSIRKDMMRVGLLDCMVQWVLSQLNGSDPSEGMSIYQRAGMLSYLVGVLNAAGFDTVAHLVPRIYCLAQKFVSDSSTFFVETRSSALVRKTIIKIYRTTACIALWSEQSSGSHDVSAVSLEDVIEHLLFSLSDKDTPVRYAASKAISVIARKLDQNLARDIVEALLGSLSEELPLDKDLTMNSVDPFRAVNPLRWHGLILTLAHLLLHRSPPPEQIPRILDFLFLGLQFEQRSSTGSSFGGNVRDAACFGIWALSRRYTTTELLAATSSEMQVARRYKGVQSLPQIIATELIVAASLDPIGNIRRGASAALQEMIGRHQDTVVEGIPAVVIVDYHAVALRTKAIMNVGLEVSKLDRLYWDALLAGLLGWRGLGSSDARSRRAAASAVGMLSGFHVDQPSSMVRIVVKILEGLQSREVAYRHGLLLSLSAMLDALLPRRVETALPHRDILSHCIRAMDLLREEELTMPSLRPELTAEASCRLISSMMHTIRRQERFGDLLDKSLARSVKILELSLARKNDELLEASANAARAMLQVLPRAEGKKLVGGWISRLAQGTLPSVHQSSYLSALGEVYQELAPDDTTRLDVIGTLIHHGSTPNPVETRVVALQTLSRCILPYRDLDDEMVQLLKNSLDDYSIDSRGDVGSWIRQEAVEAFSAWLREHHGDRPVGTSESGQSLASRVARLSVEKMDKVRLRASACLHQILVPSHSSLADTIAPGEDSHGSSQEYFRNTLEILSQDDLHWLHVPLLEGYVTSAGAGSESVLQAARRGLLDFLDLTPSGFSIVLSLLLSVLSTHSRNDRIAVPTLEVLGFLLDAEPTVGIDVDWPRMFRTVQHSHYKSKNIFKLEAAIKVYSGLATISTSRKDSLGRLLMMLAHPFPKVRCAAAESLYLLLESEDLTAKMARADWSLPTKQLEGEMQHIKGGLKFT
ncbi:MAG: hypothetical protein M1823_004855 [Watsoniomyces obsoletus]|nr:MAG: hypothetical protein M1823_004855 [Watsoniomyces obsoletus]